MTRFEVRDSQGVRRMTVFKNCSDDVIWAEAFRLFGEAFRSLKDFRGRSGFTVVVVSWRGCLSYGQRALLDTGEQGYFCKNEGSLVLDRNATSEMIRRSLCGKCVRRP